MVGNIGFVALRVRPPGRKTGATVFLKLFHNFTLLSHPIIQILKKLFPKNFIQSFQKRVFYMVGNIGFEPMTPCL